MRSRIALILALLLALVSCSKAEFSVSSTLAQPYVLTDGRMGLSVYVLASESDESSVQFSLRDPSGNLSWSFGAKKLELDGAVYLGSSDIGMPEGTLLPEGEWTLDVLYKDGSKVTRTFDVDYGDVQSALARYREENTDSVWYDSDENLTVLPLENTSDDSTDLSE